MRLGLWVPILLTDRVIWNRSLGMRLGLWVPILLTDCVIWDRSLGMRLGLWVPILLTVWHASWDQGVEFVHVCFNIHCTYMYT